MLLIAAALIAAALTAAACGGGSDGAESVGAPADPVAAPEASRADAESDAITAAPSVTPAAGPREGRHSGDADSAAATPEASAPQTTGVLASGDPPPPGRAGVRRAGFHAVLSAQATLRDVVAPAGSRLVLSLRDATRPEQSCESEHPLSGCATVDWSDFEGRPGVPDGGVFTQRLTLALADGPRDFFLSEREGLASQADDFSPG